MEIYDSFGGFSEYCMETGDPQIARENIETLLENYSLNVFSLPFSHSANARKIHSTFKQTIHHCFIGCLNPFLYASQ
jgi:hypothetical protein